jgi:hypothetical protein
MSCCDKDEMCAECKARVEAGDPGACEKRVVVVDDSAASNKSELLERVLTVDEARAAVCRSTAKMLVNSIEATEAELAKAKAAGQDGPAEETGRRIVQAARELGAQLITQARRLDRPLILRPERRMKVVRPQ